jgi:hypothetical protein
MSAVFDADFVTVDDSGVGVFLRLHSAKLRIGLFPVLHSVFIVIRTYYPLIIRFVCQNYSLTVIVFKKQPRFIQSRRLQIFLYIIF